MKTLVTGATGFVGYQVVKKLLEQGHEVVILSRSPDRARSRFAQLLIRFHCERLHVFGWDAFTGPPAKHALDGVEAVINLAGEPLAEGLWNADQKRLIRESRSTGTRNLVRALENATKPCVLISSSAIGFYGDRGDERLDESACAGEGFLSEVCRDWEREAIQAADLDSMRVVRLRMGMVLGTAGGAFQRLLPIFRWGMGGTLGSGNQWISWIHEADLVEMIFWALKNEEVHGAINAVAPKPVTNREFTRELGAVLGRPTVMSVPRLAVKLALGELSDVVLQSQRVLPVRALEKGFAFQFEEISTAFASLLKNPR